MLELQPIDHDLLNGTYGRAAARAMSVLVQYGKVLGASQFVDIASAHIDGCLYHGPSSIDFARLFLDVGGRVRVPTTLNVGAADTMHPDWNCSPAATVSAQAELNMLYEALGCLPTLTCAPYQRSQRPAFGQHIAWAESNAIVFANSVIGARTDRYGDFTDLCAALTGRVPLAGLHCDEQRLATTLFTLTASALSGCERDLLFHVVGYVVGHLADGRVPLIEGLPLDTSEDELKALGAAAASSGSVAMFHALGITPEAPTLAAATGGRTIAARREITELEVQQVIHTLCPLETNEPVAAMCLGTPHFSRNEFAVLARLLDNRRAAPTVEVYVSTSRAIAAEVMDSRDYAALTAFGVKIIVDTCSYVSPFVRAAQGAIVTNSAKFAHYGPGNLGRRVGLMTLERCVRSAEQAKVATP